MKSFRLLFLLLVTFLCGCTSLERTAHLYAADALPSQAFRYSDGGFGLYYTFRLQPQQDADTAVFFFAATGCTSLKSVMPDYVKGLGTAAQVYALNKRFVADRSTGLLGCGDEFHLANHPHAGCPTTPSSSPLNSRQQRAPIVGWWWSAFPKRPSRAHWWRRSIPEGRVLCRCRALVVTRRCQQALCG